jgi:peptidyl-prolyl cis-trans isomerase D
VQAKYSETLEKLADLSYQTPDSLDMVSKALDLPIMQTDLFDKHGGSTDFTKNASLLKAAFSHDVLEMSNNSEPIQIDNDRVVVIRVNKRIAASKIPLPELKQEIRKLISTNMAKDLAKKYGEEFMAKQQKSVGLMPIDLAGKQIKWISVKDVARDNSQDNYFVNELAFSILKPKQLAGKLISDKNYIIVSLDKIRDGDLASMDKEQIASISQQLETSYGLRDYSFYINGLLNQAKIVKNQDA